MSVRSSHATERRKPIKQECVPRIQTAVYKLVPDPMDPSRELVVHIKPMAITSWYKPTIQGVYLETVNHQPVEGDVAIALPNDEWMLIDYEGLPAVDDHEAMDKLNAKVRDWIKKNHPEWIS